MIALSTAKISQASLSSLDSTKIALQAQQYAAAEASVLQATNYDDLTAHDKEIIQNSNYLSEVELSEETDYNDDIKQRTATIRIYRGSEVLPRYTLESILLSKSGDSGVPIGTVIAWPVNSLPQKKRHMAGMQWSKLFSLSRTCCCTRQLPRTRLPRRFPQSIWQPHKQPLRYGNTSVRKSWRITR